MEHISKLDHIQDHCISHSMIKYSNRILRTISKIGHSKLLIYIHSWLGQVRRLKKYNSQTELVFLLKV